MRRVEQRHWLFHKVELGLELWKTREVHVDPVDYLPYRVTLQLPLLCFDIAQQAAALSPESGAKYFQLSHRNHTNWPLMERRRYVLQLTRIGCVAMHPWCQASLGHLIALFPQKSSGVA